MALLRKLDCLVFFLLLLFVVVGAHSFIMADETGYTGSGNAATFAAAADHHDHDNEASTESSQQQQQQQQQESVPLLPEPDANANLPSIKLGETISLEAMGPIILNADGT